VIDREFVAAVESAAGDDAQLVVHALLRREAASVPVSSRAKHDRKPRVIVASRTQVPSPLHDGAVRAMLHTSRLLDKENANAVNADGDREGLLPEQLAARVPRASRPAWMRWDRASPRTDVGVQGADTVLSWSAVADADAVDREHARGVSDDDSGIEGADWHLGARSRRQQHVRWRHEAGGEQQQQQKHAQPAALEWDGVRRRSEHDDDEREPRALRGPVYEFTSFLDKHAQQLVADGEHAPRAAMTYRGAVAAAVPQPPQPQRVSRRFHAAGRRHSMGSRGSGDAAIEASASAAHSDGRPSTRKFPFAPLATAAEGRHVLPGHDHRLGSAGASSGTGSGGPGGCSTLPAPPSHPIARLVVGGVDNPLLSTVSRFTTSRTQQCLWRLSEAPLQPELQPQQQAAVVAKTKQRLRANVRRASVDGAVLH
jgi:hypothetical protein